MEGKNKKIKEKIVFCGEDYKYLFSLVIASRAVAWQSTGKPGGQVDHFTSFVMTISI